MQDQGPSQTSIDAMADIVRGPTRNIQPLNGRLERSRFDKADGQFPRSGSPADSHKIGFAAIRQAFDEVEKRLLAAVSASEEVMRFHARPEPMKDDPMQGPGERPDGGTVWDDLATRAVLLSRAVDSLERNLKITLDTLR